MLFHCSNMVLLLLLVQGVLEFRSFQVVLISFDDLELDDRMFGLEFDDSGGDDGNCGDKEGPRCQCYVIATAHPVCP